MVRMFCDEIAMRLLSISGKTHMGQKAKTSLRFKGRRK